MDLQAQLALKGIKIISIVPDENETSILFSYKWVTPSGDIRWDNGFISTVARMEADELICKSIIKRVERIRESLKDKTPEVL